MKPRLRHKPTKIVDIDLQVAVDPHIAQTTHVPPLTDFEQWARTCVLAEGLDSAVIAVRVVDESEMAELNGTYRHKTGSTNVLSFPCDLPAEVADGLLGDVIICAPVVAREAQEQGKLSAAHWCHMLVHGILHVLGYDHEEDEQARLMEARERRILAELGFEDPYRDESANSFAVTEVNTPHNE